MVVRKPVTQRNHRSDFGGRVRRKPVGNEGIQAAMNSRHDLAFYWVDVFTAEPFAGNPLAVVPDADGMDASTMRRMARELNQSETTFLMSPPAASGAHWKLRSFTAAGVEVFGAGHNALGAWWWLAEAGRLRLDEERMVFRQAIGDHVLSVEILSEAGTPVSIGMAQAAPLFGATFGTTLEERAALGHALGLSGDALQLLPLPAQVVSTGAAHLMVQVADREALTRCRPDAERLLAVLRATGAQGCYVFALTSAPEPTAHARFFNPTVGILEDPATGSAAGPLANLLSARGLLKENSLVVHQGFELQRPSRIDVRLEHGSVRVFGRAVVTGEGKFYGGVRGTRAAQAPRTSAEVDHLVCEVSDPVASARFFEELLELSPVRLAEYQRGEAPFLSVRVSEGTIIDLFPPKLWSTEKPRNPNHVCLATSRSDFARLSSRLAQRSIPITRTDEHNFGARGFGHSLYFDGPDGLSLELRYYDETSLAPLE